MREVALETQAGGSSHLTRAETGDLLEGRTWEPFCTSRDVETC